MEIVWHLVDEYDFSRGEMLSSINSMAERKSLEAPDWPFDRIDAHTHLHRHIPALVANLEKENWHALTICVWEQYEDQRPPKSEISNYQTIDELHAATYRVHLESRGRIAWAATIDAHRFEEHDFTESTIASLHRCFREEAVGVKIWKTIGMKIRGKAGNYLMPDDLALLPIYEAIQKADRTLIVHAAEPDGAWVPLESPNNIYAGYYRNHPHWHVQKGQPDKKSILLALDRILARIPKLRVVGCHLGSNEGDFQALAKRLDTNSNFSVDMSARTRHFFDGDPRIKRQFIDKYQDRLIYGSDYVMGTAKDDHVSTALLAHERRDWSLFAGNENITYKKQEIQQMALPGPLLRKLFHDNAVRMIPGISPV